MSDEDHTDPPVPIELVNVVIVEQPAEPPAAPKIVDTEGEPWNVMNTRYGHATAMVNYAEAKEKFDAAFPGQPEPTPMESPSPRPAAISAGMRIIPDPAKYVIDRDVAKRTELRRKSD